MRRLTAAALFALCLLTAGCDKSPTGSWAKAVAGMSLNDLADKMQKPESPAWPRVSSKYAISKMPAPQRPEMERRIGVLKAFRSKLEKSFVPHPALDKAALTREVETLAALADKLRGSGGYGNLVVADSIDRLLVFRLSGWIIDHPGELGAAKPMVERLAATDFDPKETLLQLADEDNYLNGKRADIGKIESDKHLFLALKPIGLQMSDVMGSILLDNTKTSVLLEHSSGIALVVRMTEMAAMKKVHLPGLVSFLDRGGQFGELNLADVRAFESRMEGVTRNYRYLPMGIIRLTEAQPLYLLDLHTKPTDAKRYLELAIH